MSQTTSLEQILREFRREARELAWSGELLEQLPSVTRRATPDGEMNLVSGFSLNEHTADKAIREQIEHFHIVGRSFEWKVFSYDTPPDLLVRLKAHDFAIGPMERIVVYPVSLGLDSLQQPKTCVVRRVESLEQLAEFRAVAEPVFGKDYSFTTNQLADALRTGNEGHRAYVGYVDDHPVSVGRLYTDPRSEFAGLYGGGTLKEFRGQGCYRAVVGARAYDALERGARYLQVDALPTSLPILLQLGFVRIADTWACDYDPERSHAANAT